jgi:hypothetical protein
MVATFGKAGRGSWLIGLAGKAVPGFRYGAGGAPAVG